MDVDVEDDEDGGGGDGVGFLSGVGARAAGVSTVVGWIEVNSGVDVRLAGDEDRGVGPLLLSRMISGLEAGLGLGAVGRSCLGAGSGLGS